MANTKNLFVFLYEVADIIPVLIAANINLSFLEDPLPSTSYKLEMANAMLLLHKAELLTLDVKDKILTSDRGGLTPKKFAEKLKAEKPPEASPPAITFSTQRSHDKSHTSEAETANPLKETSYKGTKLQ